MSTPVKNLTRQQLSAVAHNQRLLTSLKQAKPTGAVRQPVTVADVNPSTMMISLKLLTLLWETLNATLPEDSSAVVQGFAGLVHPHSAVIFALARGSETLILRLPEDTRAEVLRAPFEDGDVCQISPPHQPNIIREFGADWVEVSRLSDERLLNWVHSAFDYAG